MYHLKRIILLCLFVVVGFSAYAQTPTDRANFLTEKMNVLLNLTAEQLEPIRAANLAFFEEDLALKEHLAQDTKIQQALADQLSVEMKEKVVAKLAQVRADKLRQYNELTIKPVLSEQQYSLYIQNQATLLQSVVDEYGE